MLAASNRPWEVTAQRHNKPGLKFQSHFKIVNKDQAPVNSYVTPKQIQLVTYTNTSTSSNKPLLPAKLTHLELNSEHESTLNCLDSFFKEKLATYDLDVLSKQTSRLKNKFFKVTSFANASDIRVDKYWTRKKVFNTKKGIKTYYYCNVDKKYCRSSAYILDKKGQFDFYVKGEHTHLKEIVNNLKQVLNAAKSSSSSSTARSRLHANTCRSNGAIGKAKPHTLTKYFKCENSITKNEKENYLVYVSGNSWGFFLLLLRKFTLICPEGQN